MRVATIQLADQSTHLALIEEKRVRMLDLMQVDNCHNLADLLHSPDPIGLAKYLIDQKAAPIGIEEVNFRAPVDRQEIWAAGVTYKRSQVARMEESDTAASHYDRVYTADRPELFFKATPSRVSGPGDPVRVRFDSGWSVPEPELALMVSPEKKLVGLTVGNDMSARDIEGENPLYLPQAKFYNQCCGLGPCVLIPEKPIDRAGTSIVLSIKRGGSEVFSGETNVDQMARSFEDLISWLGKENDFPHGAILLTGTGIVPPDEFTLEHGDEVAITITGIGTLVNPVVKD
ncbi:Fumarylacetoacetate (FAA) hydrolase family protein [Symmachiella macrocystis]|uniref:Fumarylacetoacetate (FAA) hydrolase family protein n=1 Tax=Symmachiella macrocystis TaxID=2527985 RepID=A0A5C6BK09_9PLAN|nr:fumarylacetoacetate hydrolase family protein [Symmachiella macrocystis]TWU11646.1 Fumarylacetoacetate (FAA) hydrolase family protein [Symmachiella macrocystis]